MPQTDLVTLRELETHIDALKAQMCLWIKAHAEKHDLELKTHNAQRDATEQALELQAAENLRRLDNLNHEARERKEREAKYLLQIVFDTYKTATEQQLDKFVSRDTFLSLANDVSGLRKDINSLQIFEANIKGQIIAYSAAFGFGFGVVAFILNKVL